MSEQIERDAMIVRMGGDPEPAPEPHHDESHRGYRTDAAGLHHRFDPRQAAHQLSLAWESVTDTPCQRAVLGNLIAQCGERLDASDIERADIDTLTNYTIQALRRAARKERL